MESGCVYEEKTVIHELNQGSQMAKQLRLNLNSSEAREFLIHNILSSYDKALLLLKSGCSAGQTGQLHCNYPRLPEPSISTESPRSGELNFDQKVVSKNLKVNTSDLGATVPWSFSFPSTPFGFIEDDQLLQGYSPPFISTATCELNYIADCGNSPPLDFPDDLEDLFPHFEFNTSFF